MAGLIKEWEELPQAETKINHYFSDGIYARELFIPKHTFIIGKLHTTAFLNTLTMGEILVTTNVRQLRAKAPYTFESLPGEQKAAFTLEDCVWTTLHKTDLTDPDEIVKQITSDEIDDNLLNQLDVLVQSGGYLTCQ